jgi:hypothetical protein
MGILRRLNEQGDTEMSWEPGEEWGAKLVFDAHIKAGGLAFDVPADPREPAEVIRRFNPEAKEIILAPRMVGG